MTDETGQKILDAALKLFSEKGYAGATTRVIAAEAGFTEMTLYTKFKTKQNLYDQVMIYGMEKLNEDVSSLVFIDKEFEEPRDFLDACVRNLSEFVWNNFEFFNLAFNQDRKTVEQIMQESIYNFSKYIEKHIPRDKIDFPTFTLDIFSFIYMLNLAKYHGHQDMNREKILDKYIHNLSLCIE